MKFQQTSNYCRKTSVMKKELIALLSTKESEKIRGEMLPIFPTLRGLLFLAVEVLVFTTLLTHQSIGLFEHISYEYFMPLIELQKWTKDKKTHYLTYYRRHCDISDQTAFDTSDLIVARESSTDTMVGNMNRHGVQIFPNLLSESTASELRDYVLEYNKKNENVIGVIENTHRQSFYVQVDQHPSVAKALNEMLSNSELMKALRGLTGQDDPALSEIVVLTSEYGATEQYWHPDNTAFGSALKYSRTFAPVFSLFTPLQNTTAAMGATSFCPGSHFCSLGCPDYCNVSGVQASGAQDLWPAGWGALMNTQTFHKGSAHTDPNGPPRVLLIPSFSARPLSESRPHLETRVIPHGSVYGTYWTQWGHTVSDYRDSIKFMKNPWRALKSFRLFNTKSYRSWDFWDQALNRIAVNDVAFTPEQFVESKGFFIPWIPTFLFGKIVPDDEFDEKLQGGQVLLNFLLETMINIRRFLTFLYWINVSLYILLVKLRFKHQSVLLRVSFLVFLHTGVVWVVSKSKSRLAGSDWARSIRFGRLFNLPKHTYETPKLFSTLPLKNDILITDHMKSEYLASYQHILDEVHPGNRDFSHVIIPHHASSYSLYSVDLQRALIQFTEKSLGSQGQRLLTRTEKGNWGVASKELAGRFFHKEFMKFSDRNVKIAIQILDSLMNDSQYGYWRDTALHRRILPPHFLHLQDKILRYSKLLTEQKSRNHNPIPVNMKIEGKAGQIKIHSSTIVQQSHLLEILSDTEPFEGAWLEEGDLIEAVYDEELDYWYPAEIIEADSALFTYSIKYLDGDITTNVSPRNIRRWEEFHRRELLEVYVGGDEEYAQAYVVKIIDTTLIDVIVEGNKSVVRVSLSKVRRPRVEAV